MTNINLLIVTSNYYEEISNNLISTTINYLKNINVKYDIENVEGSLEIPQAINYYFDCDNNQILKKYNGFIALGCVIKGETYHFEVVSNESNRNLMNLALKHSTPIGNGIITAYEYDQALMRSHKKGIEASKACLNLINLKNKLKIKV